MNPPNLPPLPFVQANLALKDHTFSLRADAGWQTFPVPLRPLESITIRLSGQIVYHYHEWTTSGACGKKKNHVDIRRCGPNEDHGAGVFGLADSETAAPFIVFDPRSKPNLETFIIEDKHVPERREGRLAGIVADCLNGNGGDNQGAYQLEVTVDWSRRTANLIKELAALSTEVGEPAENKPLEPLTPREVAARILRWETPRIILTSDKQQEFCEKLTDLGNKIIKHNAVKPAAKPTFEKPEWAQLASWLGEWSVTDAAGGRASHAAGWILRGDVAAASGDLTLAMKWFTEALKNAEPGPILYKIAKIQEIKGIFFSPKGQEPKSISEVSAALEDPEQTLLMGACDLYELSLGEPNSEYVEAKEFVKSDKVAPAHLTQYDTLYALGRLKYLRHTTRPLTEAVGHFRQATKLARYRAFTRSELYAQYNFLDLLQDYRRTHANPFYTGGRVADRERPALVGFKGATFEVACDTGGFEAGVSVTERLPVFTTSPLDWIGVTGFPSEGFRNGQSNGDFKIELTGKPEEYYNKALEQIGDILTDEIKKSLLGNFLEVGDGLFKELSSVERGDVDLSNSIFEKLQQPACWLDFVLKHGFGSSSTILDFKSLLLSNVNTKANGEITLTFNSGNFSIKCECEVIDKGLRIERIEKTEIGPDRIQTAFIEYKEGDLISVLVAPVAIAADYESVKAGDLWTFNFSIGYHDKRMWNALLSEVVVQDRRFRSLGLEEAAPVRDVYWKWTLTLNKKTTSYLGSDVPSLASAYQPFIQSARPELYRKVDAKALRWLLGQPLPAEAGGVIEAVVSELGGRMMETPRADSIGGVKQSRGAEAASVLFDVMVGHFDSLHRGQSSHAWDSVVGAACSAILAASKNSGGESISAYAERAAGKMIEMLGALAARSVADRVQLAKGLTRFPIRLVGIDLPSALEFGGTEGTRSGQLDWGYEKRLTLRWLDMMVEIVALNDAETVWWLATPLVANGLSDLALSWLTSVNLSRSLAAMQVLDWLSARALPATPPQSEAAPVLERSMNYPVVFQTLEELNQKLGFNTTALVEPKDDFKLETMNPEERKALDGLFRRIYSALGYALDVPWSTFGPARSDALECGEQVLKRLINDITRRGKSAVISAESPLLHYLLTLRGPLDFALTSERSHKERSHKAAQRNAEMCGRILREFGAGFDSGSELANAQSWRDMLKRMNLESEILGLEADDPTFIELVKKDNVASISWMRQHPTIAKIGNDALVKAAADQIKAIEEKKATKAKEADEAGVVLKRPDYEAGQISVVEMNSANYNSWELVLNDEPYTDAATALLALADRHLARGDRQEADRLLQEAAVLLCHLETDESDHISPEDRWQVQPMLRRVKLRIAWLEQGRDPYGRFLTQAPPRRLKALVDQFSRHLARYEEYLKDARKRMEAVDQLRRQSQIVDLQKSEATHAARQAERQIEKCKRLISNAQARISSHEMRLTEMRSEMQKGESQYKKGKDQATRAVSDLGTLAIKAATSYLPVPASIAELGLNNKDLIQAVTTIKDIKSGKPVFETIAAAYGQDLIQMSFASFDAPEFLKGNLEKGVKDAMKSFATEGKVDLKNLSQRTMQRLGEDLFKESCARLGNYLENELPNTAIYQDAKEQWTKTKEVVLTNFGKDLDVQKLRQLVNRVGINVDERVNVLESLLKSAIADIDAVKSAILAGELSPDEVVRSFRRLVDEEGAAFKVAKTHAEKSLQSMGAALLDPSNWWKLAGLDNAGEKVAAKLQGALGVSCGRYIEMLEVWSSVAQSDLKKEIQDFGGNTLASIDLSMAFVRELDLPWERLKIEIESLSAEGMTVPAALSEQFAKEFTKDLTERNYRKALEDALKAARIAASKEVQHSQDKALAAFREVCALATKIIRAAEIELATQVRGQAIETLAVLKTQFDETITNQLDKVEGKLKDALAKSLGNLMPSLDRMILGLADREMATLAEALKSGGQKVFGKGEELVDLILGNKEATPAILCWLEKDSECKVPLPNGLLEAVLNAGLQPVNDARANKNEAGPPDLDNTLENPKFTLSTVEAKFTVKLGGLTTDKETVIQELAAEALMPQFLNSEALKDKVDGLNKSTNPINLEEVHPKITPSNKIEEDYYSPEQDDLSQVLGNPGVQALVAAISTSIPAIGIAVQAVSIVNNWLCGTTEQNAGAKKVSGAMSEARQVDQAVAEARQQREIAELELYAAQDDLSAAHEQRHGLERLGNFDAAIEDRDVYLQRMVFRQMSANIELITYDLYVLQKAFEYEFDAKLEEIFTRWPALIRFRPLLELSPGTLTGEFDRTNVHQDLLEQRQQLVDLPEVVQLVRDLAMGTRYRNSRTISIEHDYPAAWSRFLTSGSPILFETRLRDFVGIAPSGRPMRHSVKIKSVKVKPILHGRLTIESVDNDPAGDKFTYQVVSPEEVGTWRGKVDNNRSAEAANLAFRLADRLAWAVFHCGVGWQIDDTGALRWIEWGPQVVDSNHPSEENNSYYNALEGLTPASRWILDYDRSSGILPIHIKDFEVTVEVTYGMIEENIRHAHAALSGIQASEVTWEPVSKALEDDMEAANPDSSLARALARRQIQALHVR